MSDREDKFKPDVVEPPKQGGVDPSPDGELTMNDLATMLQKIRAQITARNEAMLDAQ